MARAAPTTVAPTASTAPTTTAPPTTVAATTAPTAPATTAAPTTTTAPACTPDLAGELASTGSARQLITVTAAAAATTTATLELWERQGACWTAEAGPWAARIGRTGFSDHHREGDGSTPTGLYGIGPTMYGNAPDPGVRYAYHQLSCGDWWDEDPTTPAYNTFQHVACGTTPAFGGGSEALWQETAAYPAFAVVQYNAGPIVAGAGSAIFVHADIGSATDGCVSLPLPELDLLLRSLDPAATPAIAMGPASEITRF